MIERHIIGGRPASVAYTDPEGNVASKSAYAFARVLFDDGESMFLANPDHDAQLEAAAWNKHREGHRRPIGQPYAKRRASRREQTPHNAAIAGFATAINEAEKHRRVLKRRFGYTDSQIGTMAMLRNSRKRTS